MGDQITYHFGTIAAACESIEEFLGAMDSTIEDLEGVIQPIIQRSSGAAVAAYTSAQADWSLAAQKIHEILNLVKQSVAQGSENMNVTDTNWARAFEG